MVSVVIGSESDRPVAEPALKVLEELGISHEVKVLSAHRTPQKLEEYVKSCGAEVFIAIAGLSAHLPGFIASRTTKPVIGVPVGVKLSGLDALLSIVQMPRGVPVACVGIDNAENAAVLAAEILALKDPKIAEGLLNYRRKRGFEEI
ncbi:MAG: 5-(carboxyamino)imidazole ribonucleotide mutase [Candidatus Nezhaarchaeota archaeon]|nr:5-(carboxyamino)imidazole ribonucleotide mutase [Candidatus Nezhaarchaeota archaeon]